jgi:hypothetical protein
MANKLLFYFSFIALIFLSCEDKRDYDNPLDPAQSKHIQKPTITNIVLYDLSKIEITMLDQTISLPSLAELHYTGFIIYRNEGFGPTTLDDSAVLDTVSFATVLSTTGGVTSKLYVVIDTSVSMEIAAYNYAVKGIYNDVITPISDTKSIQTVLPPPNLWALTRIDDQSIELKWEHIWSTSSRIDSSTKSGDNKASVIEEEKIEIDHLIPILKESKNAEKTQKVKTEAVNESTLEIKYLIERSIDSGDFTFIDTVDEKTLKYIDKGLKLGKYSYRVRIAVDEAISAASIVQSTTLIFLSPIFTSTEITGANQITLQWQSSTSYQTGFVLQRRQFGGQVEKVDTLDNSFTSFIDNGVSYGNQYEYSIHAYSNINQSDLYWSNTLNIVLSAPYNLLVSNSVVGDDVTVSWSYVSSFQDGFRIERKLKDTEDYQVIDSAQKNALYITDDDVTQYNKYIYRVRAYSSTYSSDYSETYTFSKFKGNIIFVSLLGSDNSGNGSETKPFKTVQNAVDRSLGGDLIILEEGTYIENITTTLDSSTTVSSRYVLDNDLSHIDKTIIRGNTSGGRVISLNNGSLVGLTITNGTYGGTHSFGASIIDHCRIISNSGGPAISVQLQSYKMTIKNSVISNNESDYGGAGLYVHMIDSNGSIEVKDSEIRGNRLLDTADGAGGVYIELNSGLSMNEITFNNVKIDSNYIDLNSNYGDLKGIGFYLHMDWGNQHKVELNNCTFNNNGTNYYNSGPENNNDGHSNWRFMGLGLYLSNCDIFSTILINNSDISNNRYIGKTEQNKNSSWYPSAIYVGNKQTVIRNSTIKNNTGNGIYLGHEDGGIILDNNQISNNTVTGLTGYAGGGGVRNSVILNCNFVANEENGMRLDENNYIKDCWIADNDSIGIFMLRGNIISRTEFAGNSYAVSTSGGSVEISNSLFIENEKAGILSNNTSLSLFNNTFAKNGYGVDATDTGLAIVNSIIYFNDLTAIKMTSSTLQVIYSNMENGSGWGQWSSGDGNIDADPLFESIYRSSSSRFKLKTNSPCINTGNPASQYNDADGTRNDMGAFGGPESNWK